MNKNLIFIGALMMVAFSASSAETKQPNIVLIIADDLGYKDLGYMGNQYIRTPNIDKLATQSMDFTNAYAACTVCLPTRSSLMTGKNPTSLGINSLHDRLPKDGIKMLPEELNKRGYQSVALGKWHINREGYNSGEYMPVLAGFDKEIGVNHAGQPASYFSPFVKKEFTSGYLSKTNITTLKGYPEGAFLTDVLSAEAAKYIKEVDKSKPFFVYMSYYAVHTPIMGKKDKIDYYKSIEDPDNQNSPQFAALVESMDDGVGTILKAVEESGVADNTVVIFMSDNGGLDPVSNNGILRWGKGASYEGGTRTAFLFKWPGVTKVGAKADQIITSADIAPTLAEIAGAEWGIPSKPGVGGYSFVPVLKDPDAKSGRDVIYWEYLTRQFVPSYFRVPARAVRQGDWKLIRLLKSPGIEDHYELYNLKNDLGENNNLAAKMPEKLNDLKTLMAGFVDNSKAPKYDEDEYCKRVNASLARERKQKEMQAKKKKEAFPADI